MINTPALNIKTRSSEQLLPTPRKKILGDRISVLLIIPNLNWIDQDVNSLWDVFPWNLCLLAAMVEDFCEVTILDAYKENLSEEDLFKRIESISPDVMGVTVLMDQYGEAGHLTAKITKSIRSRSLCNLFY